MWTRVLPYSTIAEAQGHIEGAVIEERFQLNWDRYMEKEMSTAAILRGCGSLYGVRSTVLR